LLAFPTVQKNLVGESNVFISPLVSLWIANRMQLLWIVTWLLSQACPLQLLWIVTSAGGTYAL